MSDRDQIKELALAVNEALSLYIAVHDAIFQESATLKSFLKNLVGRGVPMSRLLEKSEQLVPLWDDLHARIAQFHRRAIRFFLTKSAGISTSCRGMWTPSAPP